MPVHVTATVRSPPIELLRARDAALGARAVRNVRHIRVRAGVYARRSEWEALAPWDRYLARVHAYALVAPSAVFAYESAAALRGLPLFGEPRDVHVFDPARTASRRFGDVAVHTGLDGRVVAHRDGLFFTTDADTALDLMRVLPPALSLAVGDAAISRRQGGMASLDELRLRASVQVHRRGRGRLALLLPLLDGRSESTGESVSRAVILWSGFEAPDLQVVFRSEGHTDRADFAWRSVRAIGESDGYDKYDAGTSSESVQRIILEKRREDRLRRLCDGFARWDMRDALAVAPLVANLERLRVPRVARPRPGLLVMTTSRSH